MEEHIDQSISRTQQVFWSEHAKERAQQRFSDVDLPLMYAKAKRVGKKMRKKIRASCPNAAKKWMTGVFAGRYCRITRCGIVFVVQIPETIITVFRVGDSDPLTISRTK